jgi:hypothetical protein
VEDAWCKFEQRVEVAVTAYFTVKTQNPLQKTEENHKNLLSHNS